MDRASITRVRVYAHGEEPAVARLWRAYGWALVRWVLLAFAALEFIGIAGAWLAPSGSGLLTLFFLVMIVPVVLLAALVLAVAASVIVSLLRYKLRGHDQ